MDKDRYIWCRNCDAIHRVSPFDRAPAFSVVAGEPRESYSNDWQDFMARHAGHKLEGMVASGHDYYPNGSAADPMGVRYIEVGNERKTLLLRRSRTSIEEAFCYTIVDGRLVEDRGSLEIQENAIRKEMKLHFSWAPATPLGDDQIGDFVGLFREIVGELDPEQVQGYAWSDADDNVVYCALGEATVTNLMARCESRFRPSEVECLRRFVEAHRQADDVMALVKRRAVTIEQGAERRATEPLVCRR